MKWLVTSLLVLSTHLCWAQNGIKHVSVSAKSANNGFDIHQELLLNTADSTQTITLKFLKFEGTTVEKIQCQMKDQNGILKALPFEFEQEGDINILKVNSVNGFNEAIQVDYRAIYKKETFYLPLIFTDLPALSSENNFFKMEIFFPSNEAYYIHLSLIHI